MLLYDDSFAFVKCAVLIIAPYVSESLHTKKIVSLILHQKLALVVGIAFPSIFSVAIWGHAWRKYLIFMPVSMLWG